MKPSNHPKSSGVLSKRLSLLAGIVAVGVGGYLLGVDNTKTKYLSDEKASTDLNQINEDELRSLRFQLFSTRKQLAEAIQKNKISASWLESCMEDSDNEDDTETEPSLEERCSNLQGEVNLKRANEISDELGGINNEDDKETLAKLIGQGFKKIRVILSEYAVVLSDPMMDSGDIGSETLFRLNEPLQNIPEEYKRQKNLLNEVEEEILPIVEAMDEAYENGDGEAALIAFDFDSDLPEITEDEAHILEPIKYFHSEYSNREDSSENERDFKLLYCSAVDEMVRRGLEDSESSEENRFSESAGNSNARKILKSYLKNARKLLDLDESIFDCMRYLKDFSEL